MNFAWSLHLELRNWFFWKWLRSILDTFDSTFDTTHGGTLSIWAAPKVTAGVLNSNDFNLESTVSLLGKCYIMTRWKRYIQRIYTFAIICRSNFPQTEMCVCVCLQTIEHILWAEPIDSHFAAVQPALNQPCCRSHVWQDSLWTGSTVAETTCAQQKCREPSAESSPTHQPRLRSHSIRLQAGTGRKVQQCI